MFCGFQCGICYARAYGVTFHSLISRACASRVHFYFTLPTATFLLNHSNGRALFVQFFILSLKIALYLRNPCSGVLFPASFKLLLAAS